MKVSVNTLAAISAAFICHIAAAQSTTTIYGLVDMSIGITDNGIARRNVVDSGVASGSRLGFRGMEDLGGGLMANYTMEMGINADSGGFTQGGLAFGRQIWVGLEKRGEWSLSLGRQYSPMNLSILQSDTFMSAYWGNLLAIGNGYFQAPGSVPGDGTYQSTGRVDNSILGTATFGSVLVRAMLAGGNETPNGAGRMANLSATYTSGPWLATASYGRIRQSNSMISATQSPQWQTEKAIGGSYNAGWIKVSAGHYRFDTPLDNRAAGPASGLDPRISRTQSTWIGARIPAGPGAFIVQTVHSKMKMRETNATSRTLAGAYEYPISKRTQFYVSVANVDNGSAGFQVLAGGTSLILPAAQGSDLRAYSLGLRHTF